MTVSAIPIGRPVATVLVATALLVLGCLALSRLPIASLPNVERPTIVVEAYLPGASAETITTSLAQPLERELGAISGVAEMSSYSANGGVQITIQFDLARNIDGAAADVFAAINAAGPNLPKDLPRPPTYFKANPSSLSAIVLALTSETVRASELYELADSVISPKLASLPGVAQVQVSGGERGAVRIRASARRLASMKVSLEEVRQAIQRASRNLPKGGTISGEQSWTVVANDQLVVAAEWRDLVITMRNGAPVHLADIAEVVDSVLDERSAGWFNTQRAVILFVRKQTDANVVQTVDSVKAALPALSAILPADVKINTVYDRTTIIRAAVSEVGTAIRVAICLIVGVVAVFLRRVGATLVPALSIPVTLAATMIGMAWLGYSLDNLSLIALVIAVGFIVDDAVIVVERVVRLVEEGRPPREAALTATRDLSFTIIVISAALVASLLPILFMPDVAGRYFREFGTTLALAILASAVTSLTLVPMLCSQMVRAAPASVAPAASRASRTYAAALRWSTDRPLVALFVLIGMAAGSILIYDEMPKGLMPTQDTGLLQVRTIATPNVSFRQMERLQRLVAEAILEDSAVSALSSWIGGNGSTMSNGNLFVGLKPVGERPPVEAVIERLRARMGVIQDVRVFFVPMQDLSLTTQNSPTRYQYTILGTDPEQLWQVGEAMRRRMLTSPALTDIVTSAERSGLKAGLVIDRQRSARYGVTPLAVDNTLYDAFGQRLVGMTYLPSSFRRAVLEVDAVGPLNAEAMKTLFIPGINPNRPQVPLGEIARPYRGYEPLWIRRIDQSPAVTLSFDTRPGHSIDDAIKEIRSAEQDLRWSDDLRGSFRGEAGEASRSNMRQSSLIAISVLTVYIVLGILYESVLLPIVVLSTLPSSLLGALFSLKVSGTPLTLIAGIGCILIIGMAMKNSVLVVDYALLAQRRSRLGVREAALEAAVSRARPIIMTTIVAVLGAIPLALGQGAGHELRQPLGIAIIGGLLISQLATLFTTPALYIMAQQIAGWGQGCLVVRPPWRRQ